MISPLAIQIVVLAAIVAERVPMGSDDNVRLVSVDGKTETWLTQSRIDAFATATVDGSLDLNTLAKDWSNKQLASENAILVNTADHDALNAALEAQAAQIEALKAQVATLTAPPAVTEPTPVEPAPVATEPTTEPPVVVPPATEPPAVAPSTDPATPPVVPEQPVVPPPVVTDPAPTPSTTATDPSTPAE